MRKTVDRSKQVKERAHAGSVLSLNQRKSFEHFNLFLLSKTSLLIIEKLA